MKIEHIGYAVKNMDNAINSFKKLGYSTIANLIKDETRNIFIQFMEKDGIKIELVSSIENNSPVKTI